LSQSCQLPHKGKRIFWRCIKQRMGQQTQYDMRRKYLVAPSLLLRIEDSATQCHD
jgi:hypothetical protein